MAIKKVRWILLCSVTFFSLVSWGALPGDQHSLEKKIVKILESSIGSAAGKVYKLGPRGYEKLRSMSFSNNLPMTLRWKSFLVMTQIGHNKSLPEISRALKSSSWFLRSAALIALKAIDKRKSQKEARRLFKSDKALMVRMSAFEILKEKKDTETRHIMWEQLNSPLNFYRGKGLAIRKRIMDYLAVNASHKDVGRLKKLFTQSDIEMQKRALPALEKIFQEKPLKVISKDGQVAFWKDRLAKASSSKSSTL